MLVPAVSVIALLDAMQSLGVPLEELREDLALPEGVTGRNERVPRATWTAVVKAARSAVDRPTLALEAGMAVPYGGLGLVDYLVGSSSDLPGCLLSLESHFAALASGIAFEMDESTTGEVWARFLDTGGSSEWDLEFSLGLLISRFRHIVIGVPVAERAILRRSVEAPEFARCLEVPVAFAGQHVGILIGAETMQAPLLTTDDRLHDTLTRVAEALALGADGPPLELAVRARLRDLLPLGRADAPSVARRLGVSERTLSRRLAKSGRTFRQILDAFRADESERLLLAGERSFAEIASHLGYGDQSAWTKAFHRWRGCTPGTWVREAQAQSPQT